MGVSPGLFGIVHSNRDFSSKDTWGKNQFNSSFPASLACYLYSKDLKAVYYKTDSSMHPVIDHIAIDELYGTNPLGADIYFAFETQFIPFQKYVLGSIPRNDLVIMQGTQSVSSLEIKLTALPDNPTCDFSEDLYGSEIVIRPDTIIYLACAFIRACNDDRHMLQNIFQDTGNAISDWTSASCVLPYIYSIYQAIQRLVAVSAPLQSPVVMEPVWKTRGKSPQLADDCLDMFIWSNCGLLNLFMPTERDFIQINGVKMLDKISRHTRTMVWLFKMLKDYADAGHFDGSKIIDELSYNTKNDKAFASNGLRTHPLMACSELTHPRITKGEIKNIILGGGQNLLSPERRFDAIIYNSPDLFKEDPV